jgi:hypothetical protein
MTFPLTKSVAAGQPPPNPVKITDCPVARMKLGLNTTLIVLDADNAPDADAVNPTVQVEVAFAAVDPVEKVALVGAEADAACADKVAARPPMAAKPATIPMSRLDRRCSRAVDRPATRENKVMELSSR